MIKKLWITVYCLSSFISLCCLNTSAADENAVIRLTTTTSLLSSGLMEQIKTAFESDTGYVLSVEAVGTGRALRRAREGNTDVLIVHSTAAELKFMREGFGRVRLPLMSNEFILAGPEADPAGVAKMDSIARVFETIAAMQQRFVSRGDDSGTHKKELEIWHGLNIEPQGHWYIEYGHGMGRTLSYAAKLNAYILVDSGTWLATCEQTRLVKLFEGDAVLKNPYHIISVNPGERPDINAEGADRFVTWMTSTPGQNIIRDFTIDGVKLFTPAGKS